MILMKRASVSLFVVALHVYFAEAVDSGSNVCSLDCKNGSMCRFGKADFGFHDTFDLPYLDKTSENNMYCQCPTGFTGLKCEIKFNLCSQTDHVCYNGAKCKTDIDDYGEEYQRCDCDMEESDLTAAYAGKFCQHAATVYCAPGGLDKSKHAFCTNGGQCVDEVNWNEEHEGCICQEEFEGPHCEYRKGTAPLPDLVPSDPSTSAQESGSSDSSDKGEEKKKGGVFFLIVGVAVGFIICVTVVGTKIMRTRAAKRSAKAKEIVADSGMLEADGAIMPPLERFPTERFSAAKEDAEKGDRFDLI